MKMYLAQISIPGYLPQDDDPPEFEHPCDAWAHLYDERCRDEANEPCDLCDDTMTHGPCGDCDDDSETGCILAKLARRSTPTRERVELGVNPDGTGTILGPTPGYRDEHDLGLAYSVSLV